MLAFIGSLIFMVGCLLFTTALSAHRSAKGRAWGRSEFFWDAYVVLVLACITLGLVLVLRALIEGGTAAIGGLPAVGIVAVLGVGAALIRLQRRSLLRTLAAGTPPVPPAANDSRSRSGGKRAA